MATVETSTKPICRHCKIRLVNRPRGLCWHCYYSPGVRELFPSTSKYARRGLPDPRGEAKRPRPTRFPPGSYQKFLTMCKRARNKEELFNRQDAKDWEGRGGRRSTELMMVSVAGHPQGREADAKRDRAREGYGPGHASYDQRRARASSVLVKRGKGKSNRLKIANW